MRGTSLMVIAVASGIGLVWIGAGSAGEKSTVTHLAAAQVSAAFAKGAPLLELQAYKIHASRREAPGMAEIHAIDTDIIYVLDGAATLVTGGTIPDAKTTAPGEIRGATIQNGEVQKLVQGDVVVVPNGTPHWFKEVTPPFLYYVVKVASHAEVKS